MPDICRKLLDSLDAFLPTLMHLTTDITGRLEHFRSEVLARYAPQEKKSMDMPSFMNDLSMSLESFQVPELPIVNTRAGLYIYLGAAVGILLRVVSVSVDKLLMCCSLSVGP